MLVDFPKELADAEMLEQYRGGMNAFVHVSQADEVENYKLTCKDCGKYFFSEPVVIPEKGVYIETSMPENCFCVEGDLSNLEKKVDSVSFERKLEEYQKQKETLLPFYEHYGLLVDFELRQGFGDYNRLRNSIQATIKH